jgi:hypothetical protein
MASLQYAHFFEISYSAARGASYSTNGRCENEGVVVNRGGYALQLHLIHVAATGWHRHTAGLLCPNRLDVEHDMDRTGPLELKRQG